MKPDNIKIIPQWSKSKDEIWNESFAGLEDTLSSKNRWYLQLWKYVAVGLVTIILSGTIIAWSYNVTKIAERGSHLAVKLPDGSKVNLNADSRITYKPYWWLVSRSLSLEGEAYFEVKKGKRFSVKSNQYNVNVLGTSFNIYSRQGKYSVTCLTGKVSVLTDNKTALLHPDMRLTCSNGKLAIEENINAPQSIKWIDNKFVFERVPLVDVVSEVERQFNIHVKTDCSLEYTYTGNFSRTTKPEEVLEIIGKPFGIKFSIE